MIKKRSNMFLRLENLKYKLLIPYGVRQIKKNVFWFVDIPRSSSTSIRLELAEKFGRVYSKNGVFEKKHNSFQIFPNHFSARAMRDIMGKDEWKNIFSFTIVRNPWDRIVSLYFYRLRANLLRADMTFREYVLKLKSSTIEKNKAFKYHGHYFGNSDYILDENDNIIVNFIAKYENRDEDIKYIGEKIGFPELGKLTLQKASPNKMHYSEYYDGETKEIIRSIYSKDIDLFGYKFETKNTN
jgi:hypothetical protein